MPTHRVIVWGLSAAAVVAGFCFSGVPSPPEEYRSSSGESVNSVGWVELKGTLMELRVTWNPRGKARIIDNARKWGATFEAPILWLLARPNHDLFEDALFLAGELGLQSAHPRIVELAQSGRVSTRVIAVVAAERLKPWSMEKLMAFLDDQDIEVQRAALEVAGRRDQPPVATILAALRSEHEKVREAALEALPRELAADDLQILFAMVRDADREESLNLMRVFKAIEITGETDMFLTSRLADSEPAVKQTVLEALTRKGSRLQNPRAIWRVVRDLAGPLEVRATAFRCLEKTRSYDIAELRDGALFTEPVLRYYAARCMLDAGERDGAGLLLDMLREGEGDVAGDQAQVFIAARRLLSQLSGTSAGIEAWNHWFWYGGPPRIHRLPEPPIGW